MDRMVQLRRAWRGRAPMEMLFSVLGVTAYALAVTSLCSVVFLFVSFDDADRGFPAGEGFLKAIKGYGIAFFIVAAVVFYALGRWLFESRVPGARDAIAARYETSRMATELAAHPDFQSAGTWEWRERVAYDVVPELREYAESDDWADRRFARQTVKEAWELYLKRQDSV